jgi:hypothetical protein
MKGVFTMAATPIPPVINNHLSLWQKYRHDVLVTTTAVALSLLLILLCYHFFLRLPESDVEDAARQDVVKLIFTDAYWFHELYVRWTVVDWILTFLATGTALSAVIKNAYSVKTGASDLSRLDKLLIVLAVLTVLATTFDGKLHAGQLAEKYRAGDLILQEAKIDYAGSTKDAAAVTALKNKWHEAQNKLESTALVAQTFPDKPIDKSPDKASPNSSLPQAAPKTGTPPNNHPDRSNAAGPPEKHL